MHIPGSKLQNSYSKLQWLVLWCAMLVVTGAWAAEPSIESLFPVPGFAEGWALDGKVKRYAEENLYVYINGEAELYLPYGFEVLGSGLYAKKGDPAVGLIADIYRMRSALDAFGIYSNYRDPDMDVAKVGTDAVVNESQLLFYKDRYFVRLSSSGTSDLERAVYMAAAAAIARKIPGDGTAPSETLLLSVPGVVPRTEKYIAVSVLGYAFFPRGLIADARVAEDNVRLFVVMERSPEGALAALRSYAALLKEAGAEFRVTANPEAPGLDAKDPLYKGVIVRQKGSYLVGAAKLTEGTRATALVDAVLARIK